MIPFIALTCIDKGETNITRHFQVRGIVVAEVLSKEGTTYTKISIKDGNQYLVAESPAEIRALILAVDP